MSDELNAKIAELLDVHRGWCNYCMGREFICDTRPECAARKVRFQMALERATPIAPPSERP